MCTIPEIIRKSKGLVHIGTAKYHYFHHASSITTTYNIKKIRDFSYAITHVQRFIQENYHDISDALVFYLNNTYLSLMMMCEQISYYGTERNQAKTFLQKNWKNPFSRKKVGWNKKIVYCLLRLRLYRPLVLLKRYIKKLP